MKNLCCYLLPTFLFLIAGCDSSYEETVIATPQPPELEILNDTDKPVFYFVIETEDSYLIDLADPCENFQPNLHPKSTIAIPYDQISGMDKNADSVWFMWTDCQGESEFMTIKLY
ncbi:MAG: hypothetical protein HUJ22_11925 [Gracilimonas sp.]|uniref:hypothetical protein n=1 Tax=Gracilimonas sp. TaxID=1974203 RepID=UPI0019BF6A5D|nr:hypothetical protein [Gracilimonas sp.]MBD3617268.1 hypothetical protein [Gracilimonas sp.]